MEAVENEERIPQIKKNMDSDRLENMEDMQNENKYMCVYIYTDMT